MSTEQILNAAFGMVLGTFLLFAIKEVWQARLALSSHSMRAFKDRLVRDPSYRNFNAARGVLNVVVGMAGLLALAIIVGQELILVRQDQPYDPLLADLSTWFFVLLIFAPVLLIIVGLWQFRSVGNAIEASWVARSGGGNQP